MNKVRKAIVIILCMLVCFAMMPATAFAASKPAAPKSVKCTTATTSTIKVSWKKVGDAKQYIVYEQSGSSYVKVGSTKKTNYTVKNLAPGTQYTFKVAAKSSGGTGKKSKAASTYTVCAAPAGVTASPLSKTSAAITWGATTGAIQYNVYVSASPAAAFSLAGTTAGTGLTASGLTANTTYYFKVQAVNAKGVASSDSAVAPVTTYDGTPIGVTVGLLSGSGYMPLSGGTCALSATIAPADADRYLTITWSSSNTGVATVDQTGKVTAKGVGDATITATTANGKTGKFNVKVAANVTGVSFYTDKQTSGTVSYDMKAGDTIPMIMPTLAPTGAYSVLTFSSSNTGVASVIPGANGTYSLKGNAAGTATIKATSINGISHTFNINVKAVLTNVTIPASYSMAVSANWIVPVTLTPASGAYGDYVLASTDPTVLRIEQNKTVHSIKPGTAKVQASLNGVVKSTCTVTVNPPPPVTLSSYSESNPGIKYYNVTYESNGKATVSLGVVPITGATQYVITEHVNYTSTMQTGTGTGQLHNSANIVNLGSGSLQAGSTTVTPYVAGKREWLVTSAQIAQPLTFKNVDTGLRFYSVAPFNSGGTQVTTNTFVARVPALYFPRNVGGANQSAADGYVMAYAFPMTLYMYPTGLWTYLIPSAPIDINLTFDKIPGAAGYEIAATLDGTPYGGGDATVGAASRITENTGFTFQSGEAVFNIKPFVIDPITNSRLYGEMRTVTLRMKVGNFPTVDAIKFWENSNTYSNPSVLWNFGV